LIITTVKHGRRKQDSVSLAAHLAKTENAMAELVSIGNCVAQTLPEALSVMEVYRAASNVGAAFHHCTVNPAAMLSREDLLRCVHRLRQELDPELSRPFVIAIHLKARARGVTTEHAHLILCTTDHLGKALDDRFTVLRTERLARELEFDFRDVAKPLLGRHHIPVVRALKRSRPEVAQWLEQAHGPKPEKPQSSISEGARNRARSAGFKLPKARAYVEDAWERSAGDIDPFVRLLATAGFEIVPGERVNVWIIKDQKGNFIGSVDRILRMKHGTFDSKLAAAAVSFVPGPTSPRGLHDRKRRLALGVALIIAAAASARKNWSVDTDEEAPANPGRTQTDLWGIALLPKPRR
jgi:hypothetical protein